MARISVFKRPSLTANSGAPAEAYQQIPEKDFIVLASIFESFNINEIEADLLQVCTPTGIPELEWFSLMI